MRTGSGGVIENVCKAVKLLLAGRAREKEISDLAHFCHGLARVIVGRYYVKPLSHFALADYDQSTFAWRCIEELFLPKGGSLCAELRRTLASRLDGQCDSPENIVMLLRSMVSRKIAQTVPDIYAELDPAFGRILRNVKRYVHGHAAYNIRPSHVGLLVVRVGAVDGRLRLPEPAYEDIVSYLVERSRPGARIPELVDNVFAYFDTEKGVRPALPLVILAAIVRDFFEHFNPHDVEQAVETPDTDVVDVAAAVIDTVVSSLRATTLTKAVQKGKVSEADADRLSCIVRAVLMDLAEGKKSFIFRYFSMVYPDIPHCLYRKQWHSRVEYLLKVAKKDFRSRWELLPREL